MISDCISSDFERKKSNLLFSTSFHFRLSIHVDAIFAPFPLRARVYYLMVHRFAYHKEIFTSLRLNLVDYITEGHYSVDFQHRNSGFLFSKYHHVISRGITVFKLSRFVPPQFFMFRVMIFFVSETLMLTLFLFSRRVSD